MKFKNKIKEKFAGMQSKGIDKIEPREEEPETNPLNEMNEEVEEQTEEIEEQKEKQVQQIPVPVFFTQADINKMTYETNLLVKDIYNSLKEGSK